MIDTQRKAALWQAIAACSQFILSGQSADGSWTDWKLPPGESTPWTTAFVGYRLRLVPAEMAPRTATARRAAAEWLVRSEFPDGGWGYNETVASDADSTAYAILFLASEGHSNTGGSLRRLMEFQRADGGFSTYVNNDSPDSWRVSHPDVSAVAVSALLTKYSCGNAIVDRGVQYVLAQIRPSGLWNSFWWDSSLYGTDVSLSLVHTIKAPIDAARTHESLVVLSPHNAFESALLISSILYTRAEFGLASNFALVDRLIDEQRSDGSWESVPILRVTRRDCFEPWDSPNSGTLFADPARLFTSSTVLEALLKVYAVL